MDDCPCGSGRAYAACCGLYISGKAAAPTAEALMRSRYSAYAKREVPYLMRTCLSARDAAVDEDATRRWAESSEWLGLRIIRTEKGGIADQEGLVEFVASYAQGGLRDEHHETAIFKRENGEWKYDTGEVAAATIVRAAPKVGRNDPCPCGSGKKYKHCCG